MDVSYDSFGAFTDFFHQIKPNHLKIFFFNSNQTILQLKPNRKFKNSSIKLNSLNHVLHTHRSFKTLKTKFQSGLTLSCLKLANG